MSCFRVMEIPDKGKGIISSKYISSGTVILQSDPITFMAYNIYAKGQNETSGHLRSKIDHHTSSTKPLQCLNCLKYLTTKPMRCNRCKCTYYCNPQCQRKDWPTHKLECTFFNTLEASQKLTPTLRLIIRLILKDETLPSYYDLSLEDVKQTNEKLYEELIIMSEWITISFNRFFKEQSLDKIINQTQVFSLFIKVSSNAFTLCDDNLNSIGIALYPSPANYFNHSCQPNCNAIFVNSQLWIVCHTDCPVDQELTISYVDLASTHKERWEFLEKNYFFRCKCEACERIHKNSHNKSKRTIEKEYFFVDFCEHLRLIKHPIETINECILYDRAYNPSNTEDYKKLQNKVQIQKMDTRLEQLEVALENVLENNLKNYSSPYPKNVMLDLHEKLTRHTHPRHLRLHRLREKWLKWAISCGDYEVAFKICDASIASYLEFYGYPSALLGLQLLLRGQLALFIEFEHLPLLKEGIKCATSMLRKTHGVEHPIHIRVEQVMLNTI